MHFFEQLELCNTSNNSYNGGEIAKRFRDLEQNLGYEFYNKNLLLQAFTHQDFETFLIKTLIKEDLDLKDLNEDSDPQLLNIIKENKSKWDEIRDYDF